MKATELKRKTPLKANPDRPLKAKAPMKRKAFRPKPMPLKTLKLRCDVLWRTYVKREGRCLMAHLGGCKGDLQAAHLIGRAQSARIRYHPENAIPLCVAHHYQFDGKSIGQRHIVAEVERMFPGRYDMLEALARVKTPMKAHEWKAVYEGLKLL